MVHVVQEDEMVSGLVQQLSSFSTDDERGGGGGGGGEMDISQCRTHVAKSDHGVALNPFGNPIGSGVFQDQAYGSGSMMSSPGSIPTSIEQLLLPTSTVQFSPRPSPNSITTNAVATTSFQNIGSNLSQLASGSDQNPPLEEDSSSSSMQQDTQTLSSSTPAMEDNTEHS